MINLMYVVLMAMLALNVSSDVLKGFALVEESLSRTADNVSVVNKALFENFQKGVNLGGWISQFAKYDKTHFDTFITEKDIAYNGKHIHMQ